MFVFFPAPGSKEFWINQPVKVMNVVCPALAGQKPAIRLNASLDGAERKSQDWGPAVAVYRRQYPHLFKGHHFTFGKQTWDVHALVRTDYMYSRSGLVPDEWSRIDVDILWPHRE